MLQNAEPLKAAIASYNKLLKSRLAAFTARRAIKAKIVDTHVPFNEALNNPQKYGSPNATCWNQDGKSCVSHVYAHPCFPSSASILPADGFPPPSPLNSSGSTTITPECRFRDS